MGKRLPLLRVCLVVCHVAFLALAVTNVKSSSGVMRKNDVDKGNFQTRRP